MLRGPLRSCTQSVECEAVMNLCPPKLPVRDPSSVPFTHRPNSSARSRLRVDAGVAPYFLESCVSVSRDVTLAVTCPISSNL